jgi:RNA polymerase sigma factor (sigma-70 family)
MLCLQPAPSDIELWQRFKQGDRDSFGELFRRNYSLLISYGNHLCRDHELLEDCIQELFLEIWQSQSNGNIHSVRSYLLKALKYKIYKKNNGRQSHSTQQVNDDLAFEVSHENFLIRNEEEKFRAIKLIDAISQLPNRQKEIVYLKLYQGLNYEELSEVMQINYQVARNLFSQAISSLRKMLVQKV